MLEGVRIDVLVPAHNEARHIGRVLSTMPAFVDFVWVIDDGSTDATWPQTIAHADARTRVLRHPSCWGVGAALRTGYGAAFQDGAQAVAVMAGDGQMDPADLQHVLSPLLQDRADYVKGNRLGHLNVRQSMPVQRWVGNHALSWLTRVATGLPIQDSQCGYTALHARGAAAIPLQQLWTSYGYPNDLLGWAALKRLRVAEVPVRPIYADEVSGIRLHHALGVVPGVLLRVAARRAWSGLGRGARSPVQPEPSASGR